MWFSSKYGSYEASLSFRAYTGAVTLYPNNDNQATFGLPTRRWQRVYATNLCSDTNGVNLIGVPNKAGTMALMSDVELAANSGSQLYTTGVWYAKMYSASTVPTGAEYNGRNYADFSQVDSDNNPVIKIYTGASGAWTLTETITPPATYNGYITVTSKIWDIAEQSGQQGGQILWSYSQKTFTPYPRIISFDNANITNSTITTSTFSGTATLASGSTVIMPENPSGDQIVNKDYVDAHAGTSSYHPDLFDWKWADHQLDDVQWLRADTFSWQDGDVYEAAYDHLADDVANGTIQNETIAGILISYYLAPDGHKITTPSLLNKVEQIYNATGVAWYYVWDNENKRFKLPRTKFGVTGLRDTVGNYVAPGLPNITGTESVYIRYNTASGAFQLDPESSGTKNASGSTYTASNSLTFDASRSSSIYGASTTVQAPATQMYLYFYVGEFTQTAIENTAGLNAELFNDKVDLDADNFSTTGKRNIRSLLLPDYANGITVQNANASSGTYTAPTEGQFMLSILAGSNTTTFKINNVAVGFQKSTTTGSYSVCHDVFVKTGDVMTWTCSASVTMAAQFYPF